MYIIISQSFKIWFFFGYYSYGWGRSFFSHPYIRLPLLYWCYALSLTSLHFIWHWSELKDVADIENIWNKSNGDNALQYWTIKNTEAQHVAIIEDEGKLVESSVMSSGLSQPLQFAEETPFGVVNETAFHYSCYAVGKPQPVGLYAPSGPSISSSFSFQHLSDALWTGTTITKLSPLTGACCKISGRFLCLSLAITHSILAVRYLGLNGMLSNPSSKEPALDKLSKGLMNSSSSHTWKAFFRVVAVDRENLN